MTLPNIVNVHVYVRDAPKIGVFGSDGDHCTEHARDIAYTVGRLLAEEGAILFTGGGTGVMEAASRGASEYGGLVVGILPGANTNEGNKHTSLYIPTGMGYARCQIFVNSIDGAIIIEGGIGTRQEASEMYLLQKPTVAIASSGGTAAEIAGKTLDARKLEQILSAQTPEKAVKLVLSKIKGA